MDSEARTRREVREERGEALYREKGAEIVLVGTLEEGVYSVPGSRGETYEVNIYLETCTCADAARRDVKRCKHVEAVHLRDEELKRASGYYEDIDFKDLL